MCILSQVRLRQTKLAIKCPDHIHFINLLLLLLLPVGEALRLLRGAAEDDELVEGRHHLEVHVLLLLLLLVGACWVVRVIVEMDELSSTIIKIATHHIDDNTRTEGRRVVVLLRDLHVGDAAAKHHLHQVPERDLLGQRVDVGVLGPQRRVLFVIVTAVDTMSRSMLAHVNQCTSIHAHT